uniref:Uncharacterized protein n=1 Tax=Meloidogyne enterolobii TaxID=390850 RepID=A0A6V7W3V6_MELEN|nr:unnamed protein product [Meloidogyne enterolobii]
MSFLNFRKLFLKMKNQLEEWSFCNNSSDNINNSNKIEDETNSSIVVDKEEEEEGSKDFCCLSKILLTLCYNETNNDNKEKFQNIERKYAENTEKTANLEKIIRLQDEIKQIKAENEANIKAIKQKSKEKYKQLETENENKISNLKEIIKEKEVKITSMEKDYKQCLNKLEVDNDKNLLNIQNNFDLKIKLFQKEVSNKLEQKYKENYQSLELKIQEIKEENNDKITNLEKIIEQKDEKINLLGGEIKKADEAVNALNKKIYNITEEQETLFNVITKNRLKYIQIKNKWKYIDDRFKCCEDNCVNTKTPTGKCKNGNGFIEIINNTDIKYNKCIEEGENMNAQLNAENKLNKPKTDCNLASIFYYYEIKIKKEGPDYSAFGFRNTKEYILLGNNGYISYSPAPNTAAITFQITLFTWNEDDFLGCGLVFPPTKMLEKRPYVFFTQNGNQIGKE